MKARQVSEKHPETTENGWPTVCLPTHDAFNGGHKNAISYFRPSRRDLHTLIRSVRGAVKGTWRVRRIASGGEPCRVSLTDAREGDPLLLVNHDYHAVDSPYRMRYAVFVRPGEVQFDSVDSIPAQLRTRTLAVRSFDRYGMNLAHKLISGEELSKAVDELFADQTADYIHVHYASAGCYAARIDRAAKKS